MTRTTACIAAALLTGTAVACGSGHRPPTKPSPTDDSLVVRVVPVGRPGGQSAGSTSPTPAIRVTARGGRDQRAVVATAGPSGTATFRLPRGTYTVSAGCGGARVVKAGGRVVLPMRAQCPPP